MKIYNPTGFSSSLTGSFSGSVKGTFEGSFSGGTLNSISGAFTQDSSSFASRIDDLETFEANIDNTYATDAQLSTAVSGLNAATSSYLNNTTDTLTGDLTVTGTITAQEFHTEFVSASIIYESGSTQFGDTSDDTHVFTGKVGIGTDSPSSPLHIKANEDSIDGGVTWESLDGANEWSIDANNAGNFRIYKGTTAIARFDSSGNLGVGTSSPQAHIHEYSGIITNMILEETTAGYGAQIALKNTIDTFTITSDASPEGFYITSVNDPNNLQGNLFFLNSSGSLGIGTSIPNTVLHIDGGPLTINNVGSVDDATLIQFGETRTNLDEFTIKGDFIGTGINNKLKFCTDLGGGDILILKGDGNVGIGESSPDTKLHVVKSGAGEQVITIFENSTNADETKASIQLRNATNDVCSGKIISHRTGANFGADLTFELSDDVDGSFQERMRITETGNVGIGTVNPTNSLEVAGNIAVKTTSGNSGVKVITDSAAEGFIIIGDADDNSMGGMAYNNSTNTLSIDANNQERITILSNGNVGIGTTSPSFRLHAYSPVTNVVSQMESGDNQAWISVRDDGYTTYGALLGCDHDAGLNIILADNTANRRLVIDNSGNVGIGTTNPSNSGLNIYAESPAPTLLTLHNHQSDIAGAGYSQGSFIEFKMTDNNATFTPQAKIGMVIGQPSDTGIAAEGSGNLVFFTGRGTDDSGGGVLQQHMIITHDGRVGIGTDQPISGRDAHIEGRLYITTDMQAANAVVKTYSSTAMFGSNSSTVGVALGRDAANIDLLVEGSTGSVGIGTTAPNGKFNSFISTTRQITHNGNGGDFSVLSDNNSGPVVYIKGTGTADLLKVYDNTAEVFTIQDGGAVKITNNSAAHLILDGDNNNTGDTGETDSIIDFMHDNEQYGYRMSVQNYGGSQSFRLADNRLGTYTNRFFIGTGGDIYFGEHASNEGTSAVLNGWSFGVGGTATAVCNFSDANEMVVLNQRDGQGTTQFEFRNGNVERGRIEWTTSGTTYNTTSDYRLKENIVELTGSLDKVSSLEPKQFNFIGDTDNIRVGFLAHEVQEVIPQAVSGDKDAVREDGTPKYQALDHSMLVPVLVGAIKELKAEIETLKAQLNT